ncbi:hypothetical protein NPIL_30611 [Nephila pilipes]|uniref:Uncharacterized protein n=1 Tax=Nephila pilipes TaxID=299642 RepID=A0A8X6NMZ7_NEPPI|nr:hypothetical protein NPIL_30611 [Nephila pilipes]
MHLFSVSSYVGNRLVFSFILCFACAFAFIRCAFSSFCCEGTRQHVEAAAKGSLQRSGGMLCKGLAAAGALVYGEILRISVRCVWFAGYGWPVFGYMVAFGNGGLANGPFAIVAKSYKIGFKYKCQCLNLSKFLTFTKYNKIK